MMIKQILSLLVISTATLVACSFDDGMAPPMSCEEAADCSAFADSCQNAVCDGGMCTSQTISDGTACEEDGMCLAGNCEHSICGDGVADPGEACDDGNLVDADGCDADCSLSCVADTDCGSTGDDECAAVWTCEESTHTCERIQDARADGTDCENGECQAGTCVPATCGNARLEGTEECDDGNRAIDDGCWNCRWDCIEDADCETANPCDEGFTCEEHVCVTSTPAREDGAFCGADHECWDGFCRPVICGDSVVTGTEECDDGNQIDGDGCDSNCTFTCASDADCSDNDLCTGVETCEEHVCVSGVPPVCEDDNPCTVDGCYPAVGCTNELIDNDGDGHAPASIGWCGTDCDDADPSSYNGADEICDGTDNDCNGTIDDGAPGAEIYYPDCDRDGYSVSPPEMGIWSCGVPEMGPSSFDEWHRVYSCDDWTTNDEGGDCDDFIAQRAPNNGWTDYFFVSGAPVDPDVNCDGVVERHWLTTNSPLTGECEGEGLACRGPMGWTADTPPYCGEEGEWTVCGWDGGNCYRHTYTRRQECR